MWSLKALVDYDQWSWGRVFRVGGWYPQEWEVEDGLGSLPWPEKGADGRVQFLLPAATRIGTAGSRRRRVSWVLSRSQRPGHSSSFGQC